GFGGGAALGAAAVVGALAHHQGHGQRRRQEKAHQQAHGRLLFAARCGCGFRDIGGGVLGGGILGDGGARHVCRGGRVGGSFLRLPGLAAGGTALGVVLHGGVAV